MTNITTANAAYLFDDASANIGTDNTTVDAQFTATGTSITYYAAKGAKVEMYTITSSSINNIDPKSWTLSASNDGESWTQLDKRENESFRWRRYARPFAVNAGAQGRYKYYRLDITEASGTTI